MKLKRGPTQAGFGTKLTIFIFVAVFSIIATFNLSPEVFHSGLPQERQSDDRANIIITTKEEVKFLDDKGTQVIEHTFASEDDNSDVALEEEEVSSTDTSTVESNTKTTPQQKDGDDSDATHSAVEDTSDQDTERPAQQEDLQVQKPEQKQTQEMPITKPDNNDNPKAQVKKETHKISPKQQYHVVVSVSDGVYTEWQVRLIFTSAHRPSISYSRILDMQCYYQYKKIKAKYPNSALGGFTRLLHSGFPDAWMDEIPTVVVDPLPPHLQKIAGGYVVLNRPYAFEQWVDQYMDSIPEQYVLMAEPDHLFVVPPPLLATPTKPASFPFFYIEPATPQNTRIIEKYNTKKIPMDKFAPIGNSPVIISKKQMRPIVHAWSNLSLAIKQDKDADAKWGWVQEMYAWSIASTQTELGPVEYSIHREFILQPPWDKNMDVGGKEAYIVHYTYGNDFNEFGMFTPGKVGYWHWDKRDYIYKYPPVYNPPPEKCDSEPVKFFIDVLNEAAAHLDGWKERGDMGKVFLGNNDEGSEDGDDA